MICKIKIKIKNQGLTLIAKKLSNKIIKIVDLIAYFRRENFFIPGQYKSELFWLNDRLKYEETFFFD